MQLNSQKNINKGEKTEGKNLIQKVLSKIKISTNFSSTRILPPEKRDLGSIQSIHSARSKSRSMPRDPFTPKMAPSPLKSPSKHRTDQLKFGFFDPSLYLPSMSKHVKFNKK